MAGHYKIMIIMNDAFFCKSIEIARFPIAVSLTEWIEPAITLQHPLS